MPPGSSESWRTYTNVIFANGRLLVPTYPDIDEAGWRRTVELYRRLLPEWDVVGVDANELIVVGGALHCISATVPAVGSAPRATRTVTAQGVARRESSLPALRLER